MPDVKSGDRHFWIRLGKWPGETIHVVLNSEQDGPALIEQLEARVTNRLTNANNGGKL